MFDPGGRLVVYVEHPLLRLHDESILYADEDALTPLLVVKQRRLAAFNVEHDLMDALSGQLLGTLRGRTLKSIVRDRREILGPDEQPAGEMKIEEGHSWLRRIIRLLSYRIDLGGRTVARLRPTHLFSREFALTLEQVDDPVDPRFLIACALIAAQAGLRRESR